MTINDIESKELLETEMNFKKSDAFSYHYEFILIHLYCK